MGINALLQIFIPWLEAPFKFILFDIYQYLRDIAFHIFDIDKTLTFKLLFILENMNES